MKHIYTRFLLIIALTFSFGTLTNCAKSGCPANEALYKEATLDPTAKKSKGSKKSKNKSGVLLPEGRAGKKY